MLRPNEFYVADMEINGTRLHPGVLGSFVNLAVGLWHPRNSSGE
ncbi:MAG: hypothetical protein UX62_C0013G0012 [Microgenomates group bacterium GW2011_GWA2_46_7]|nr:MAG: hypothetical protein UX62_C0013G0012 [Microgenomates group bacterium GW2011_GWA2_46_7]